MGIALLPEWHTCHIKEPAKRLHSLNMIKLIQEVFVDHIAPHIGLGDVCNAANALNLKITELMPSEVEHLIRRRLQASIDALNKTDKCKLVLSPDLGSPITHMLRYITLSWTDDKLSVDTKADFDYMTGPPPRATGREDALWIESGP
jgi:hypothetical protein